MPTNPFDQFDTSASNPFDQFDTSASNPFDQFDHSESGSSFKSGDFFGDTGKLVGSAKGLIDQFKKEWHNNKTLSELSAEEAKSPEAKAAIEAKLNHDTQNAHAAGSAVADLLGAAPAMLAGGVSGVASGVANMDATKGLQTAGKVMTSVLPSTLMGHESDQNAGTYQAAMAPLTVGMDALNAIPQAAGEAVNAAGFPKAAAQVTDTGKLAIMAAMGVAGAREAYHSITGKEPPTKAQLKLEEPSTTKEAVAANPFDKFDQPAFDRGVPGDHPGVQGELWSQEHDTPTQPIPTEAQGELFGKPPAPEGTIDYEKAFPFDLVPKDEPAPPTQMGLNMPEHEQNMALQPDQSFMKLGENTWEGGVGSRDTAAAKAAEQARADQYMQQGLSKEDAFAKAEKEVANTKNSDFAKMEAQRELDHMNTVNSIADTPGRNFFTNPLNRDKLDLHDVTGDHGFAGDSIGDKSLMHPEATQSMVDSLRSGDIHGALDAIVNNHIDPAYRNLADYLKGVIGDVKVRLHDDGILQMGDRQATGYYDPESHTVGLSKVGAVSPHTVLHELVHSITSAFVNNRPNDLRVLGLKDLYSKLNDMGMSKEFPEISNVKEFLAEAFSNPEFQKYLQEHKLQNRSTWRRFMDNVKAVLGFSSATRNHITNALEHVVDLGKQIAEVKDDPKAPLTDAGLPGKLADLMVSRRPDAKPVDVVRNANMEALKGLDKIKAQFDFTPLKPEEIIPMAKDAPDIKAGTLETIKANLDAGGRMASLRHNNNPIVKYTFAYVDHAIKNYEKLVNDNITNVKTGVKSLLRGLSSEDFTTVHQQLMLDEGQLERTPQQMRELGWSDKMIQAAVRIRETDKELLDKINDTRSKMNPPLPPIERRMGHLAGRFLGDFHHTIFEYQKDSKGERVLKDGQPVRGKAVMIVTGSTKWGAQKLADFMQSEHPEWEVAPQQYNGIKQSKNSDRFTGFTEMMNYIAKNDPVVNKALDSLDKYNRRAATNYLNTLRHAKDKQVQAGGVLGSEGHKQYQVNKMLQIEKKDTMTNAEEGFKGHMAYMDTSYRWLEMQKAMENISKVTTDPEVIKAQPNAIQWSTAYTDHALHRNQGFLTDMAQSLLSETGRVTGIGHTNITKGINWMSTAEMRNWMGIGNIPFALKHMLLPLQKMPAMMAYLKTIGDVEASLPMAGIKSLSSYYHYLKDAPQTPFEKEAFRYAQDNNVFNVNLDNLSGRIQSGPLKRAFGKFADADFSGPEHAIRGNSFFFYSHLLKDAGMDSQSAFSSAEHLTKFLYTDYASHEAPRAAAKAGWIGQLAFQVTRYKANELSQLGFFNRERMSGEDHTFMEKTMSNLPLLTHMGSLLAFSGAVGMLGYKEMDELYSLFSKHVLKSPDNLTALLQRSKAPDLLRYGLFSRIGIDPKVSEAALLPSPFPTTAAEINQMGLAFNAAKYHDKFHMQQLAIGMAPSTLRGPLENSMFTQPPATQGPNAGKSLYLNPNTGEGRVWRTPEQQTLRNFGFHSTAETNKTENNYAISRIEKDHADIADHIMEKTKGLIASGSFTKEAAQELATEYAKHQQAGQAPYATAVQSYMMKRNMDQRQQMEYKAAQDRQMGNSLNIVERNK